jgi:hypothetical protein
MDRSLLDFDFFGQRPAGNTVVYQIGNRIAYRGFQFGELQGVIEMQLGIQRPYRENFRENVTDYESDLVGMRQGVRLAQDFAGFFIETDRRQNRSVNFEHVPLLSEFGFIHPTIDFRFRPVSFAHRSKN